MSLNNSCKSFIHIYLGLEREMKGFKSQTYLISCYSLKDPFFLPECWQRFPEFKHPLSFRWFLYKKRGIWFNLIYIGPNMCKLFQVLSTSWQVLSAVSLLKLCMHILHVKVSNCELKLSVIKIRKQHISKNWEALDFKHISSLTIEKTQFYEIWKRKKMCKVQTNPK